MNFFGSNINNATSIAFGISSSNGKINITHFKYNKCNHDNWKYQENWYKH